MALTAARNRITYTGFAFTDYRREMVMARLLDFLSAGALKAGDKWYDPNLAETDISASKTKNKRQDGDTEDGPPTKKKTKKTSKTETDKDKEPKEKGSTTKKPNQGKKTKTKKTKGVDKTDSGSSASNQGDSGSHTNGDTSEWE